MPGTSLSTYSDGTPMVASDIRGNFNTIERWLNETLAAGDLQTASAWLDTPHIFAPYVYGSPSERFEGQTAELFYAQRGFTTYTQAIYDGRFTSNSDTFPVVGLCKRIRTSEDNTWVTIKASWYTYQRNNGTLTEPDTDEATVAGTFYLYINGTRITSTRRRVFRSGGIGFLSKKQHSIVYENVNLSAGTHDLGVFLNEPASATVGDGAPIVVEGGGITVDVAYR